VFLNRITKQVKPDGNFSDIWDYPNYNLGQHTNDRE
jgi:hypothetical protein